MDQNQNEKKGMSPIVIVGVIAILGISIVGYLMSQSNRDTQNSETVVQQEQNSVVTSPASGDSSMMDASEIQTVEVEAGSFYYAPDEIRVKKGQKVKIIMKSVSMMHDFVIDELDVRMPVVKNGDVGEVEFTATEAGEFEYYCSVGQHRANGQIGKLIVE